PWQGCAGAGTFTLDDLIPSAIPDGQTVIYAGKNSLAMFTHFEKRFVRQGGAVVGYNNQSMSFVTGPGYFTVVQAPAAERARELLFDYTRVPAGAPSSLKVPLLSSAGVCDSYSPLALNTQVIFGLSAFAHLPTSALASALASARASAGAARKNSDRTRDSRVFIFMARIIHKIISGAATRLHRFGDFRRRVCRAQ